MSWSWRSFKQCFCFIFHFVPSKFRFFEKKKKSFAWTVSSAMFFTSFYRKPVHWSHKIVLNFELSFFFRSQAISQKVIPSQFCFYRNSIFFPQFAKSFKFYGKTFFIHVTTAYSTINCLCLTDHWLFYKNHSPYRQKKLPTSFYHYLSLFSAKLWAISIVYHSQHDKPSSDVI